MGLMDRVEPNEANLWRTRTPGVEGWAKSVRPGPNKYFMISADTHLMPPMTLFRDRLDKKWHSKLARIETRDDGQRYILMEGMRPERLIASDFSGDDLARSKAGGDHRMIMEGIGDPVGLKRIEDQAMDGVDAELIFPNGPVLLMWSSTDVEFVNAQCQAWNDWAMETCAPFLDKCNPAAALATGDVNVAVREVERVAKLGYRVLTLPCKPIWGAHEVAHINYNLPVFDPLWAAVQDADLAVTYHVSTGRDPRAARGNGGAIINQVVHSFAPTIEPIVSMCSSGVFERFPKLRVASVEADAAWIPWVLQKMDECYHKHHFWVRPKLANLPSDYFRSNCYATFGEDKIAIDTCEQYGLVDNLMWANDFPHHEGSWPYSAEAIERTLGSHLKEESRAKLLGLNAARVFRFDIPDEYK